MPLGEYYIAVDIVREAVGDQRVTMYIQPTCCINHPCPCPARHIHPDMHPPWWFTVKSFPVIQRQLRLAFVKILLELVICSEWVRWEKEGFVTLYMTTVHAVFNWDALVPALISFLHLSCTLSLYRLSFL